LYGINGLTQVSVLADVYLSHRLDYIKRHPKTDQLLKFLPARRYASTGNSDRNVSVRLSGRPSRAGIVSKRRKLAA